MRFSRSLPTLLFSIFVLFGQVNSSLGATLNSVSSSSTSVTSVQNSLTFQLYCNGLQSSVSANLATAIPDTYCCTQSDRDTCLQDHINTLKGLEKLLNNYLILCAMIPSIPLEGGCGNRNRFNPDGINPLETNLTCEIEQFNSLNNEMVSCLKK